MLRWYWHLCGSVYAKETRLLQVHQDDDYEAGAATARVLADHWNRRAASSKRERPLRKTRSALEL